jgi:hypothetical protein
MAACPGCQKFASLELGDAEVESEEVQEDGTYTAEIRVVRTSACCGEEMKEARFTIEGDVGEELTAHIWAKHPDLAGAEDADLGLGITVEAEPTEDVRRVDRTGKPITNPATWRRSSASAGPSSSAAGHAARRLRRFPTRRRWARGRWRSWSSWDC